MPRYGERRDRCGTLNMRYCSSDGKYHRFKIKKSHRIFVGVYSDTAHETQSFVIIAGIAPIFQNDSISVERRFCSILLAKRGRRAQSLLEFGYFLSCGYKRANLAQEELTQFVFLSVLQKQLRRKSKGKNSRDLDNCPNIPSPFRRLLRPIRLPQR